MLPGSKENEVLLFQNLLTAAKSLMRTGSENKHPRRDALYALYPLLTFTAREPPV